MSVSDGTSQAAFYGGCFQTNVFRLNLALARKDRQENQQIFIYFHGVGTSSFRYFGLAGKLFGQGLDEIILQAYVNIISNYEPGDKIYIFGFSRGAIAARALSRLISYSELLTCSATYMAEPAWRYFVGDEKVGFSWKKEREKFIVADANIEFVGVWDSVYGIDTKLALRKSHFNRLRFTNLLLDRKVNVGVHVISIDDTRRFFQPLLWTGPSSNHKNQIMEQIWLPGTHGDIGGGYSQDALSKISLICMLDKLSHYRKDICYDTEYITNTLLNVRPKDIIINNEWRHYFRSIGFKTGRCCENNLAELNQSAHPLVKAMMGGTICVKGEQNIYVPSFKLSDESKPLPQAEFAPDSFTCKIMTEFSSGHLGARDRLR